LTPVLKQAAVKTALKSKHNESQMMDIADMASQVGGAREGQSFVLKI
jgi:hypothetical protein